MSLSTKFWTPLFLTGLVLAHCPQASAQEGDNDPFGEMDEAYGDIDDPQGGDQNTFGAEYVPQAPEANFQDPNTDPTMAAQSLFGVGGGQAAIPRPAPRWGNLNNTPGGERIEDTYEMRMKEELAKPMPKRAPFGDQMREIGSRFKNKPKL